MREASSQTPSKHTDTSVDDVSTFNASSEDLLREKEARFRTIFENSGSGIALLNMEGHPVECNPAFTSLLGYTQEDLNGMVFTDLTHVDDRGLDSTLASQLLSGIRDRYEVEKRFITKSGATVWGGVTVSLIRGRDGAPKYVVCMIQDITDRKRSEQALRESEERFTAFMDNSPSVAFIKDEQGRMLYLNRTFERVFNINPIDFLGKNDADLWPSETAAQLREHDRAVLESGRTLETIEMVPDPAGKFHPWLVFKFPLRDRAGRTCLAGIGVDITERKQAEEERARLIREQAAHAEAAARDAQFRTLANSIPQLAWMADATGNIFWYNQRWYDYTGTTLEDVKGWGWQKVHHPDHVEGVVTRIQEAFSTGEPWEDTFPLRSRDGEFRWFLSRALPVRDGDGCIERWFGTNTDVTEQRELEQRLREAREELERRVAERTAELSKANSILQEEVAERKRAEEALRRVSERLQVATKAANIGIWDWDVRRDELVWDDEMYDLFGVRREDFGGAYDAWVSTLAQEDFERATADVQAALRGERQFDSEYRIRWRDGSTHFIKADAKTFRDDQGQPVRMVGVNYDITERKLVEERINFLQRITMDVAAAHDLPSALKIVLRHVCEKTGWALGQAWLPNSDALSLKCCLTWSADDPELEYFRQHSAATTMMPGIGLPGRVWAERQSLWIRDVTEDSNFPRFRFAHKSGLKSALGVPILSGDHVIAVLEFYLRERREEDDRLVTLISAVGAQIGLVCARKLAEDKLRWSEERLRLILNSAAEGIFGVDLEGRCTFCNSASLRLLSYDQPSELLGQNMHALIASRRADGTPFPMDECPAVQSLLHATNAFSEADVFWKKDNTNFPVEYWSYPMFQEGEHVGAVITFLDITERKLAEKSLRLSEERFAKAFHASPEPITIFRHRDGTLLEANERWQAVYGYTREEAIGRQSIELNILRPEVREHLHSLLEKQHSVRECEIELRTRYGETRYVSISAEQLVINDEVCDIFLHRDITERMRAEQALRKSQEKFAKAFQSSPVAICIARLSDGHILEVNDAAEKLNGYKRQEMIGQTLDDLGVWAEPSQSRALVEELVRNGSVRQREVRLRNNQGRHVLAQCSGERIEVDGEQCLLFAIVDITERQKAEEELRASREQLRALSERLRAAKEEEGMRIARELHDELGSILTSLKWNLTRMEGPESQKPQDHAHGSPGNRVQEMLRLVDATINAVRRISSELRPSVLDDLGLISAIEWHAQEVQAHTGIVCRFDSQLEDVAISKEQATTIFRIFQEAMTNILRHAKASKVSILIEEEDGEFVLDISDNGRGITESEKLGTQSLGLLGMRERARFIGADIDVRGKAGVGTQVILRVPLGQKSRAA